MSNAFTLENGNTITLSRNDMSNISILYWNNIFRENIEAYLDAYAASPNTYSEEEKDDVARMIVERLFDFNDDYQNVIAEEVITAYEKGNR